MPSTATLPLAGQTAHRAAQIPRIAPRAPAASVRDGRTGRRESTATPSLTGTAGTSLVGPTCRNRRSGLGAPPGAGASTKSAELIAGMAQRQLGQSAAGAPARPVRIRVGARRVAPLEARRSRGPAATSAGQTADLKGGRPALRPATLPGASGATVWSRVVGVLSVPTSVRMTRSTHLSF